MPSSPILPTTDVQSTQYVSWPAVFAGNAVTGGLMLVMLPLGAAAGLAMTSAYRSESASDSTIGWAAILWLAFMYLFSTFAGGYVVGRLRRPVGDTLLSGTDEVRFRDGMNGLVFWGFGMVATALFTFWTVTSAVGTATSAVGQAAGGALSAATQAMPAVNTDYISDLMLRSAAGTNQPPASAAPRSDAEVRAEMGRILAAGVSSGQVSDPDRQYLATLIAQRSGISEQDARGRVDEGLRRATKMKDQAFAKTQAAAEAARKAASKTAFWTAVLSLLSGMLAVYAARLGGRHRDEGRY